MAIFNSYVKLPEGSIRKPGFDHETWSVTSKCEEFDCEYCEKVGNFWWRVVCERRGLGTVFVELGWGGVAGAITQLGNVEIVQIDHEKMNLYELIHYWLVVWNMFFFHWVKSVGNTVPSATNLHPPPPCCACSKLLEVEKKKGVAPCMFCPHYNLINDNYPLVNIQKAIENGNL